MRRLALGCLAVLAFAIFGSAPAYADFYTLDGLFQCLDRAHAVCGDPEPLLPPKPQSKRAARPAARKPAPEPKPAPMPAAVPQAAPGRPAGARARAVAAPDLPHPAYRAPDRLHAIAWRIELRQPKPGDLAWLKRAADRGNVRAIELLAWCKLNAIGTPPDPVEAYLLYGAAARASLPHAHQNQALIYEHDLDADQRQEILDLVNEGVSLARLSP